MAKHARLRVLHLQLEFMTWQEARPWSYGNALGLEEGLAANGVEYVTITSPWAARARDMCTGQRFDQVWVEFVHQGQLGAEWMDWMAEMAPIRVGFLNESLEYFPEEWAVWPHLKDRKRQVESRLDYVTHVVAVDEHDAESITARRGIPAMWWPPALPQRFISQARGAPEVAQGLFAGTVYGRRADFLAHQALQGLLTRLPSPEDATILPSLFDTLHLAANAFHQHGLADWQTSHAEYLHSLRRIRQACFALYLNGLARASAVVNLPHMVKTYGSRVSEGMAAGRPVISWEIPNRPRTRALFEDGRDILLFQADQPEQLAEQIRKIQGDPGFASRLAANARARLRQFHSMERRTRQLLTWLETGRESVLA